MNSKGFQRSLLHYACLSVHFILFLLPFLTASSRNIGKRPIASELNSEDSQDLEFDPVGWVISAQGCHRQGNRNGMIIFLYVLHGVFVGKLK